MNTKMRPLALHSRCTTAATSPAQLSMTLGNGEYRTVLAQQRTLLAFVRTALAITAAFGASVYGVVLGCVVLAVGVFQYAWVVPLFLYERGQTVDAYTLYRRARIDAVVILTAMLAIGVSAVLYRWDNSKETANDVVLSLASPL